MSLAAACFFSAGIDETSNTLPSVSFICSQVHATASSEAACLPARLPAGALSHRVGVPVCLCGL